MLFCVFILTKYIYWVEYQKNRYQNIKKINFLPNRLLLDEWLKKTCKIVKFRQKILIVNIYLVWVYNMLSGTVIVPTF